MNPRLCWLVALLLGVASVACDGPMDDDGGTPLEDGGRRDAAIGNDGGAPRDGAAPRDAAPVDGGSTDAGSMSDAGSIGDADPSDGGAASDDAGSLPDTGPPPDAGPPPVPDSRDVYAPRPYVEQGATQSDPTSTTPIVFDVTFDEPIWAATLHASDFVIEPAVPLTAVVVDSGDGQRFELRLSNVPRVDEQYRVSLPYGRVVDLNGNPNVPSISADDRVYYDDPASTVEVRPYIGVTPVMNTLPITFQILFQARAVLGFEVSDVINGGTAPGVVWELQTISGGYAYYARATAVGGPGTVFPVVRAGATVTTTGEPNLRSFYLGEPIVYTPLPILQVFDGDDPEGALLAVHVGYQGALRPATSPLFDWVTSDGTAIAGVDYTASGGTDVAVGNGVFVRVPTTEDALPEPHEELSVRISNVRGDVYVADDVAVGTIVNDDRGLGTTGSNEEYDPDSGPTDIAFSADTIYYFGVSPSGEVRLSRFDLADGSGGVVGTISGRSSGGLALDTVGYVLAVNTHSDGYRLDKKILGGDANDPLFPDVEVTDPTDVLEAVDLAADATQLYVLGRRTSPAGETAWFIEARDVATGALATSFGSGGVLALDRASGTTDESPIAIRSDGASIFVLGAIDGDYRVERREPTTGALIPGFATGGSLALTEPTRVVDIAVHDGALYVIGAGAGGAIVERYDASTGARVWSFLSPLDDPRCITASDAGVFFGGAREAVNHVEGWTLDGDPLWGRTLPERDGPQAVTAIAHEPGSHWVHSAGFYSYSDVFDDYRDWFWERRYTVDGYRYTYGIGDAPE